MASNAASLNAVRETMDGARSGSGGGLPYPFVARGGWGCGCDPFRCASVFESRDASRFAAERLMRHNGL